MEDIVTIDLLLELGFTKEEIYLLIYEIGKDNKQGLYKPNIGGKRKCNIS